MNENIFCSICHRIPSECGGVHELNAYEIADRFEKYPAIYSDFGAAKLLRQQADRIAELEKSTMAWYEAGKFVSPQIKELSDEEIDEVLYSMDWAHDPVKFARAILKKASEK